MTTALVFTTATASLLALWLLSGTAAEWLAMRRLDSDFRERERLLAELTGSLICGFGSVRLPRRHKLRCAAETVGMLCTTTSGLDEELMHRIAIDNDLERRLLRRIARSSGYRRAAWLTMLARLPLSPTTAHAVAHHLDSRNPFVRLGALLVMLTSDPSSTRPTLCRYRHRLTALEVSEVMTILRRGRVPVAWRPLLEDSHANLRRIGMAVVRQFGIEEAEEALHKVAEGGDVPLSGEALFTLCLLRRPLHRAARLCRKARLDNARRRSLMRLVAAEGYSHGSLEGVIADHEAEYFTSRVNSYKRMLA